MVYYTFTEELAELRRRQPHVQTLDDTDAVHRFNEGSIELLAAHPKSASHGLNLQGAAHHIAFLIQELIFPVHRWFSKRFLYVSQVQ